MRRISFSALLAVLLVAGGMFLANADQPMDVDKINKKIDSFTLKDGTGKAVSLDAWKDKKAVVVVFLSFDCPVSNSYSSTLADLHKTYSDKHVAFLAITAGDDLSPAELTKKAAEFKIPFPVVKDDGFKATDLFKAKTAPEVFVLDHNQVLRYRGRIDDTWSARLKRNRKTTKHDLKDALDALLAGKSPTTPATVAIGCPISRDETTKKDGKVTYYRDVLPILQTHCQQCHRPGEVGPFSLMTFKQAVSWANDIKEYTRERKMPPWKPVEGQSFHNERKLSDKELATLATWSDSGTPEGNPKDGPKPRVFTDGWQLGKPDLVLTVPDEMTVGASGKDVFRCFVMPTGLTEDKEVVAIEVRPGNKRIVHHSLNFFDTTGQARTRGEGKGEEARPGSRPGVCRGDGHRLHPTLGEGRRPGWLGAGSASPLLARGLRLSAAEGFRCDLAIALPPKRPGREGPHFDRPVFREKARHQAV